MEYMNVCNDDCFSESESGNTRQACSRCKNICKEVKCIALWRAVISECLATFFYVCLPGLTTLNWNTHNPACGPSVLQRSLAFGFCMFTLVHCFGHISGGHVNPVVTLALAIRRHVSVLRAVLYTIAQCGGGIAGAAVLYGLTPNVYRGSLALPLLHPSLSPVRGLIIEILLTFVLVFCACVAHDIRQSPGISPALAVGLATTLCHLVGLDLTGCSINPARSLGPLFMLNRWQNQWINHVGPLIGGALAGLLYEFIFDPARGHKVADSTQETAHDDQWGEFKRTNGAPHFRSASLPTRKKKCHENPGYNTASQKFNKYDYHEMNVRNAFKRLSNTRF